MILTSQHTSSLHAQFRLDDPEPRPLVPIANLQPAQYAVPQVEVMPHSIIGTVNISLHITCHRASDWQRPSKSVTYTSPLHFHFIGSEFLQTVLQQELDQKQNEILRKVRAWEYAAKAA